MFKKGFFILAVSLLTFLGSYSFDIPKTEAANITSTYNYDLIYQSPYPAVLNPGDVIKVSLEIKNTGTQAWENSGDKIVRLGTGSQYGNTSQGRDYYSEFAASDWLSRNRPIGLDKAEVKPSDTATFQFDIKVPNTAGEYKAYFTPVVDGFQWMKDMGIYWEITVKPGSAININTNVNAPANTNINSNGSINQDALINEFAPSVVKIMCQYNDQYLNQGSGTLFYNSSNNPEFPNIYILTNLHVVENENHTPSICDIKVVPDYHNSSNYLVYHSTGYKVLKNGVDFAILEPQVATGNPHAGTLSDLVKYAQKDSEVLKINSLQSNSNSEIYVFGYPENGGLTITEGDNLGYEYFQNSRFIDTDAVLKKGNSGGLCIDASGDMLGIPTFVRGNIGLVLDIDYLLGSVKG